MKAIFEIEWDDTDTFAKEHIHTIQNVLWIYHNFEKVKVRQLPTPEPESRYCCCDTAHKLGIKCPIHKHQEPKSEVPEDLKFPIWLEDREYAVAKEVYVLIQDKLNQTLSLMRKKGW